MSLAQKIVKDKDVKALCSVLFPGVDPAQNLTRTQERIVRIIAFGEKKRVAINCFTRYGKTQCVALGVCLYIWLNKRKKVALIAPQADQTKILRDYISELISASPFFSQLVDFDQSRKAEALKKEVSKNRITFKNGCELRTLSAHGEAERLMGFGANLIIKDESCLISDAANARIMRMLGDDPEYAVLIEISNPWSTDNKYYEHYTSGDYYTIHVDWRLGIKEGRITQEFVNQMRDEYKDTPMFFTVLYDSEFPEQPEDSVFNRAHVMQAVNRWKDIERADTLMSCDVADKGADKTVILTGRRKGNHYIINEVFTEAKTEQANLIGRLMSMQQKNLATWIHIDTIGLGAGVVSVLKQNVPKTCNVIGCHFGRSAGDKSRFSNRKAEVYFRLRHLFEEGLISIPNDKRLINELMKIKWDYSAQSGKIKIIDPEKSPDFADALVYFVWPSRKAVI
jgi:hypothetical protein